MFGIIKCLKWKAFKIKKFSLIPRIRFALRLVYYESAESWENFVLLADKRLDYFLTELKLIPNLQNQQKTESDQLFTWKITTGVTWYKNW